MTELHDHINNELDRRQWSISELARRAELAQPTVSDVLNGKTFAGLRFYIGMARALGDSVDYLLRLAGELPANISAVSDFDNLERQIFEVVHPRSNFFKQAALDVVTALARVENEAKK